MDKAEFIERLTRQFNGIIAGAKRCASADIKRSRAGLHKSLFVEWAQDEILKAASEPALKPFDQLLEKTPEAAAKSIALLLEFTFDDVDWETWFSHAFLSTGNPWVSRDWPLHPIFAAYSKAFIAHWRCVTISEALMGK